MDSTLEQKLDAIAALLLLLLVIEAYRLAGFVGIVFALTVGLSITYWAGSDSEATS